MKQDMKDYLDFLEQKKTQRIESGFHVEESDLNPALFDFQKYCVKRALEAGKFALFEDCGLGKTIQQLEWSQKVVERINKPVLILAPLAVINQTIKEGEKFGYSVKEIGLTVFDQDLAAGIYITNYDNMENIDAYLFGGVVLDESSILKNFQGKTRTKLIEDFRSTPYKLACTATPSPNDTTEICNHSEFLDVMSRTEMLAMYFVHDGGSTSDWRLKGHAKQSFWDFVSTWAVSPLQLDTIDRAITLWSNEGDTVLTPFLGIGSEVYEAIKMKRFGIGFELKESYFKEAIKNCRGMEMTANQPKLFDETA